MTLDDWFRRQDAVVAVNRSEFEKEYQWLDSALTLLTELQMFVNSDPEVTIARGEMNSETALATTLTINLLNDAMGGLVTGVRLLLFGNHADAFALLRNAFEACGYAEYFVYHPDKAKAYMELEGLLSATKLTTALEVNLGQDLRKRGLEFSKVSRELEKRTGIPVKGFYARLCNLGTHASPKRVGLRLSPPGGAVLAAYSRSTELISRKEWTLVCAHDMMIVAKYAVEMLFEHYPHWFVGNQELLECSKSLTAEFTTIEKNSVAP